MRAFFTNRRWMRFSLRSLLVAVVAVSGALAYWSRLHRGERYAFEDDSGKWGFVNRDGWVVVSPRYDHALDFEEGLARVQIGDRLGYVDRSGKLRFELPSDVHSTKKISEGRIWFEGANDRWGFCDEEGRTLAKPIYTDAKEFQEGLAAVAVGGTKDWEGFVEGELWGYVDRQGKLVIPAIYESASSFEDGVASVWNTDGRRHIDNTGTQVRLSPELEKTRIREFHEGVRAVRESRAGLGMPTVVTRYLNEAGETELVFHGEASNFREGMAEFQVGQKTGFINRSGRIVVKPRFAEAYEFHDGLAAVRLRNTTGFYSKGDEWGYIDKRGEMAIPARYNEVTSFENGVAKAHRGGQLVETSHDVWWEGGEWWLIDTSGKELKRISKD